jgi:hypothetical protein
MRLAAFQLNAQVTILIDVPFPGFLMVTNLLIERSVLREIAC